ncbi:MAG: hypothetical protein WCL50_01115, partial [Spirochaetota bacterium]
MSIRPPSFRLLASLLLALAIVPTVVGQDRAATTRTNHQKIRALSDPIWADLAAVLLDAGRVELSPTAPYADSRIQGELEALDPSTLSAPALPALRRIVAALSETPKLRTGLFGIDLGLYSNPALF